MIYLDHLRFMASVLTGQVSQKLQNMKSGDHDDANDAGLGTLELVLLAIGLAVVAGLLVAAINAAVQGKITVLNDSVD